MAEKTRLERSLAEQALLQTDGEWDSIEINWKVQNVNRDNLASWPAVIVLIRECNTHTRRRSLADISREGAACLPLFLALIIADEQRKRVWLKKMSFCNTTPLSAASYYILHHLSHSTSISAHRWLNKSDVSLVREINRNLQESQYTQLYWKRVEYGNQNSSVIFICVKNFCEKDFCYRYLHMCTVGSYTF